MYCLKRKYNSNEVIVNNKSNFKSQLVRCQSVMDNIKYEELVIRGLGRATCRAINLALQLNLNNFNTFEIVPKTYSIEHNEDRVKKAIRGADKDGFDPDEVNIEVDKRATIIPAIEVVVRKNKLELGKVKQVI